MSDDREVLNVEGAPAALGAYSHAVRAGGLLFCSGQISLDPLSGELVGTSPGEQTRRCLENLGEVCAGAGTSLQRAVRLTVYTTEMGAFAEIDAAYAELLGQEPPARAVVGVAALPRGAKVEIEAVVAV